MEEEQPLYLQRENLQYILQDYYARYITREVTRENVFDMKERLKAIDRTWKNYLNTAVEFSQPDQFVFNYQISADYYSLLGEQRRKIAEFEALEMPHLRGGGGGASGAGSPAPSIVGVMRSNTGSSNSGSNAMSNTMLQHQQQQQHPEAAGAFSVTPITLPMFSGGREEWLGFRDAFEGNVDRNQAIGKEQRFHFLRSCLSGEPKKLIAGIDVRGDNYDSAWALLKRTYDDKALQYHASRVFHFVPVQDELEYIRQLLSDTGKDIQGIKLFDHLGIWDAPIILSLLSKLSNQSRALWDEKCKFMTKPTWKAMEKFLQERCRDLERVTPYRA